MYFFSFERQYLKNVKISSKKNLYTSQTDFDSEKQVFTKTMTQII